MHSNPTNECEAASFSIELVINFTSRIEWENVCYQFDSKYAWFECRLLGPNAPVGLSTSILLLNFQLSKVRPIPAIFLSLNQPDFPRLSGAKLKKALGVAYKTEFADKQTLFKPNLPTNRTFLEFHQQYNVDEHYWHSANMPTNEILEGCATLPRAPYGHAQHTESGATLILSTKVRSYTLLETLKVSFQAFLVGHSFQVQARWSHYPLGDICELEYEFWIWPFMQFQMVSPRL